VKNTPNVTIRSHYNLQQFRRVLTKKAHEEAITAVTKLDSQQLLITGYPKIIKELRTDKYHIKFYAKHIGFSFRPNGEYNAPENISFDVEKKYYLTSNHSTKISIYSPEMYKEDSYEIDQDKTNELKHKNIKRINAFIEEMMKKAGIQPEPRFKMEMMKHTYPLFLLCL
jgi:hypothetical protein